MRCLLLLLLLLGQAAAWKGFARCPSGQSCVEACSGLPGPPPKRCSFFPTRVCCHLKKLEKLQRPLEKGKCGRAKPSLEGLVIGGKAAERGKWPWMVSILCQDRKKVKPLPICTGFLIDQRHVLTAAHCFRYNNPHFYSVRLSDAWLSKGKEVRVSRVLLHPDYRNKWFHDDVALVTLAVDQPGRMPVCLPPLSLATPRNATLVAWGATKTNGGPMSERLQELGGLPLVASAECERALRNHLRGGRLEDLLPRGLDSSVLCAGGALHRDSCNGDSGGPLMAQDEEGRWSAVGVVAFGSSKCGIGVPGVYTSVAHYLPWIERNKER